MPWAAFHALRHTCASRLFAQGRNAVQVQRWLRQPRRRGTARIDWSDGSYTLIEAVDRFSFNAVGQGTTVFAEAHTDAGDFFSADGVFQCRKTFHEIEHFTVTDGVVRVEFQKGHFHFFGDC